MNTKKGQIYDSNIKKNRFYLGLHEKTLLEDDYIEDDFPSRIVEQDEDGYIFPYFSERFIYDNTNEWMIYTSHEFTITFAGKWLTEEICKKLSRSRE